MDSCDVWSVFTSACLLPYYMPNKIDSPKNFINQDLQVMPLGIINRIPNTAILSQQVAQLFEARVDHA